MTDLPSTTPLSKQQIGTVAVALVAATGIGLATVDGARKTYKGPPDAIIRFREGKPPVVLSYRPNRREGDCLRDVGIFLSREDLDAFLESKQ